MPRAARGCWFMEPGGQDTWQPFANASASTTARSSRVGVERACRCRRDAPWALSRCFMRSSDRMIQVRILYWQDIPSLIRVTAADGTQLSRQLSDHFQQEIDRAAMAQGLVDSDVYLEQWEWRDAPARQGSPAEALDAVEAELTSA